MKGIKYLILPVIALIYFSIIFFIPNSYGIKMNDVRAKLGLPTLQENWTFEKTEEINKEINLFNLVWKNTDTSSFHKYKEIVYRKSLLIWRNEAILEINSYKNYISESKYELLISKYDFTSNSWFITLDTIKNNNLMNENLRFDYNVGIELGLIGTNKQYTKNILEKWKK